eukprot:TRINITY_DN55603_c0_g1_i1.p1 TRINITY_DN55603_c0_g1~~TRINITY_DN55603_c0_g1_i1.p1  ORF type:complete len:266 (+),score=113.78 TRINITY_DN55603_c0_g1_i1:108-800(+)
MMAEDKPAGSGSEQQPELSFLEGGGSTADGAAIDVESGAVLPPTEGIWARATQFVKSVKQQKARTLKGMRPWREFAARSQFGVPPKSELWERVTVNLKYYYSNYLVLVLLLAVWTAISNLFFVICTMLTVAVYYYYRMVTRDGSPFVLRGKEVSSFQFHAGFTGASLLLFWLSGGSSVIFWLIVSVAATIGGHAALREPVDKMQLVAMALEDSTDAGLQDSFQAAFGSAV